MRLKTSYKVFGGYSVGGTPVLIPNTEVKSYSADDTAWETMWESRSPPKLFHNPVFTKDGVFYAQLCRSATFEIFLKKELTGCE